MSNDMKLIMESWRRNVLKEIKISKTGVPDPEDEVHIVLPPKYDKLRDKLEDLTDREAETSCKNDYAKKYGNLKTCWRRKTLVTANIMSKLSSDEKTQLITWARGKVRELTNNPPVGWDNEFLRFWNELLDDSGRIKEVLKRLIVYIKDNPKNRDKLKNKDVKPIDKKIRTSRTAQNVVDRVSDVDDALSTTGGYGKK